MAKKETADTTQSETIERVFTPRGEVFFFPNRDGDGNPVTIEAASREEAEAQYQQMLDEQKDGEQEETNE